MNPPPFKDYPDRMNSFMTSEHFTLQSGRSIINSEIISRVNIYFTMLGSLLISAAFLAQIQSMQQILVLFLVIAFPLIVLLGLFTFGRLMVLGGMDLAYIRAINRIRHFYIEATPQAGDFFLFPANDDDRSVMVYGGYSFTMRGNLLAAGNAVMITNCIVLTVSIGVLLWNYLNLSLLTLGLYSLGTFFVSLILHNLLGWGLAKNSLEPEYLEVRFPAITPN